MDLAGITPEYIQRMRLRDVPLDDIKEAIRLASGYGYTATVY